MKKVITGFVIICFALVLFNCRNHNSNTTDNNVDIVTADSSCALNHVMHKAIKDCIDYYNLEISTEAEKEEKPLLMFYFGEEKNGDCYLYVIAYSAYLKDFIKGYTYVDGYTVALHANDAICGRDLLDLDRFISYTDTVSGYRDQSYLEGFHEPFGIKYKVINPDSLLFVYKGMF